MIIHQIYGLWDDKPMNALFTASHKAWVEYCDKNNYIYKLWDKKQVEELIDTYSELKSLYYSVKYPVMKCDIARFVILYQFGGLYTDLDVLPLVDKLTIDENKLTFCKYINKGNYHNHCCDIEMIYSPKYNTILYEWILFIPELIKHRSVSLPESWEVRFIFHTTGPAGFRNFLKHKNNKIEYNIIKSYLLQEGIKYGDDIDYDTKDAEVISYFSMSYNTHRQHLNRPYNYKKKHKNLKVENIT